jgi:hypothetical protein
MSYLAKLVELEHRQDMAPQQQYFELPQWKECLSDWLCASSINCCIMRKEYIDERQIPIESEDENAGDSEPEEDASSQ